MEIISVTDTLFLLRFPVGQAYLWCDDDGLTLVDSGPPGAADAIAEGIRELGHHPADVRRLVLTHFHADHLGGAAEIAGWGDVTVVAHRAEAPVIAGDVAGDPPRFEDWEVPIFAEVSTRMPAAQPAPVRVNHLVDEGDLLGFGGGAQVIAVPGHTDGSIALHLPGPGVLFTGDTVARAPDGTVMRGVFNRDSDTTTASLRRLAGIDVDVACFGHGDPVTARATSAICGAFERLTS